MTLVDGALTPDPAITEQASQAWSLRAEEPTFVEGRNVWPTRLLRHILPTAGRALSDAMCVMLAFAMAGMVQSGRGTLPAPFAPLVLLAPVVWIVVFWWFGLYYRDPVTPWEEFRRLLKATAVGAATIVFACAWLGPSHIRVTLVIAWIAALTLELLVRPLWRLRLSQMRRVLSYKTLIIGTNDEAGRLADALSANDTGFLPLGYVESSAPGGTANGLKVLGNMRDLAAAIRRHGAECVFVASTGVSADDLARLATVARRENVLVRISTKLPNVLPSRVGVESIGEVAALSLKPVRLSTGKACIKRAFDIVVASALLLATLPLMLVVALAVRLSSKGPILFRQERVTKGGRLFRIYKFRTMYHHAPTIEAASIDPTGLYFKMRDDPRLTRVGRILRHHSLDELPQLWNVIRGDISLVGPRPLWSAQVDLDSETFRARSEVRAGLTGWWQVNGRSGVDADEALEMDLFYIENWSLTLDLYILLKTIPTVFRSNAY